VINKIKYNCERIDIFKCICIYQGFLSDIQMKDKDIFQIFYGSKECRN